MNMWIMHTNLLVETIRLSPNQSFVWFEMIFQTIHTVPIDRVKMITSHGQICLAVRKTIAQIVGLSRIPKKEDRLYVCVKLLSDHEQMSRHRVSVVDWQRARLCLWRTCVASFYSRVDSHVREQQQTASCVGCWSRPTLSSKLLVGYW